MAISLRIFGIVCFGLSVYFAFLYFAEFAVVTHNHFWIVFIVSAIIFLGVLYVEDIGTGILTGRGRSFSYEPMIVVYWIGGLFCFLLAAEVVGDRYVAKAAGIKHGTLYALFGHIIQVVYVPALFLIIVSGWLWFIRRAPSLVAGGIALTTSHPTAEIVQRSAEHNTPDSAAEGQFANTMGRQRAQDEELARQFESMSMWEQWKARVRYRSKAQTNKQLRELLEERHKAHETEAELGLALHHHEREKRARDR